MSKKLLPALALAVAPVAATADPTIGLGLNFTFGQGKTDIGVGLRAFSDNETDSAVASLGVDYMFKSNSLRASVGLAYIKDDTYLEVSRGYDFGEKDFDFGAGFGHLNTEDHSTSGLSLSACPICGQFFCNCPK